MAEIKAADVAKLRKLTGAGMMDCKKALEECEGDMDGAKDWLRTKGLAGATKRAGRAAEQGTVDVIAEGNVGALVELVCETDFVAKSAEFVELVRALTEMVVAEPNSGLELNPFGDSTVGETITQLGAKLGENVALGRIARFESADGIVDGYKHMQNNRGTIGVLVDLAGVDANDPKARELAHDLALHIASAAPRYLGREDVPADVVARERAVFEELTRNEGKPEQAWPKIVEGRLGGFYKDNVLLEQGFVKEPKTTIKSLVDGFGGGATVRQFIRVKIAED